MYSEYMKNDVLKKKSKRRVFHAASPVQSSPPKGARIGF